ncbi:MAG: hypothetical protein K0U68_04690 [Gammaproteobacteria bacterium]|nr:hypothetical protein [Gammaproteobacteria bacterium]
MPQIDEIPEKISDDELLSRLQSGFSEQPPEHLDQQVLHSFRESLGTPGARSQQQNGLKAYLMSQLQEMKSLVLHAPVAAGGLVFSGILFGLLSGLPFSAVEQSNNPVKPALQGELVFRNADQALDNAQDIENNANLPAQEWMARIKTLLDNGQIDKAYQQLQAYRERYGE